MNALSSPFEDSMTTVPSYLVISLALMQREHQRLDQAAKQLRAGTIPIEKLYSLRQQWQTSLGFLAYVPPMLVALDRLIEQHEHGNVNEAAYGEVLYQIIVYRGGGWKALEQQYGHLGHYLDPTGKIRPTYLQLFTNTFEAATPLTPREAAALLQHLHPQLCAGPWAEAFRKVYENHQKALSAMLARFMLRSMTASIGSSVN